MGLPQNIKRRRLELGLSQQELATALGYRTRSSIAKIESGDSLPPTRKLEQLARVLDTTVDALCSDQAPAPRWEDATRSAVGGINGGASLASLDGSRPRVAAVILAGGQSTRNMQNVPNQFINVMGKPVIMYCLEAYQRHPAVDQIYVVCLRAWIDILTAYVKQSGLSKLVAIVPAGETGVLSARNGLAQVRLRCAPEDLVILQESTRPLVTQEDISKLIQMCVDKGSATLCSPMKDYAQVLRTDDRLDFVDRNRTYALQTPDAYRISVLADALQEAEGRPELMELTTCAIMRLHMGHQLNLLECGHNNMKVVRQEDIDVVTALLRRNS
ncbi:MAG: XRE family transcriptional regulator [Coriobacteriia bacterium]|nr:XRE family transcriptional regulator [Coriobacteriia bacterium]